MRSHEGNRFVPLWNHEISLVPMGDVCRYTDRVTIGAGWRTPFVRLWSLAFTGTGRGNGEKY